MRVQGHVINPVWIVELPICNPHSADPRSAKKISHTIIGKI